jgi:MFS family permease
MKGEWIRAERVEEVRAAAGGWKRAGAVGPGTFEEISRRYPEPRVLPSPLWRVLVLAFVSLALLLLTGAFLIAFRPGIGTAPFLLFLVSAACLIATEAQENAPRLALRGGAGATSFWGIAFLLAGVFLFLEETLKVRERGGMTLLLLAALAAYALAAWRWGSPAYAVLAAISFFLLLARAPSGRLLWVAMGVAMTLVFARVLDDPSWTPSHRGCAAVLVVSGLLGVYAAVNLYALDHKLVENLRGAGLDFSGPRFQERIWAMVGTAVLPVAILWWGVRSRRTFVLDAGIVVAALSLITLRHYVHIAATWLVVTLAGTALVLLALALNRWLSKGPEKERDGFTAEPLFADEAGARALELVPVVAAHAPAPRPPAEPGFQGGGGTFGGGGAGGSF